MRLPCPRIPVLDSDWITVLYKVYCTSTYQNAAAYEAPSPQKNSYHILCSSIKSIFLVCRKNSQLTRFECQKLRYLRAAIEHVQKALLVGVDQRSRARASAIVSRSPPMPQSTRRCQCVMRKSSDFMSLSYRNRKSYANLCNLVDLLQAEISFVEMSSYAQPGRFSPADNLQGSPTPTDTSLLSYPNNEYCCGITQEVK